MVTKDPHKKIGFKEFVALMAFLISLTALSIDTILPALSFIKSDLNVIRDNQVQYAISFLFLGFCIGQLVFGPLSDSFGRIRTVYVGLAIFMFGSFLSFVAQSFSVLLIGRILQGFGVAAPRVSCTAMIRDLYTGRDMARVMSFIMAVFILVPAIAPSLGQAVLFFANWRMIFLIFLLGAIIALIWVLLRLPETLSSKDRLPFEISTIWKAICEVFKHKQTFGYTICAGLVFGGLIGYLMSAQQIFQDYFGVGTLFSAYFAILALSLGLASIVNSLIVKHIGMHVICHFSLIAVTSVSTLFLVFCLFTPEKILLWQFMSYAIVTFFCMGLLFGNLNAIAMEPMGHIAGIASAIIGSFSSAVSLGVGTVIGQYYNNTPVPLIAGFLCLSLCAFLLQLWLNKSAVTDPYVQS